MSHSKDTEMVLYAFAVEPRHDQATLERYFSKYPNLTQELISLAFELRVADAQSSVQPELAADAGASKAWQEFTACAPAKATATGKPGTLMSKFRGQAFVTLADRLKFPRSILIAFRDRQVEPDSVPEGIIARFAEATESTVQAVRDYLSSTPQIIQTAQFKADNKPAQQGRVTFRQLVENTPMTEEERKVLLGDSADGHDRG
jgi:hypothetical protein